MQDLNPEPSDAVRITIPRWVFNRIAVLLVAENAGRYVSDTRVREYVVAVLEGHAKNLNP